jgi:hypothetical protein
MSANLWVAVAFRSQAREHVQRVSTLIHGLALEGVTTQRFAALPKTKCTWVTLAPMQLETYDAFVEEHAAPLARALGKQLGVECWVVASSDYSGREFFCAGGDGRKRWQACDDGKWREAVITRGERALAKATTPAQLRVTREQARTWEAEAHEKSATGRFELELGARLEADFTFDGEAKRALWRKTVRVARAAVTPAPVATSKRRRGQTALELALSETDLVHLRRVASRKKVTADQLLERAWALAQPDFEQLPPGVVWLPTSRHAQTEDVTFHVADEVAKGLQRFAARIDDKPARVLCAAWLIKADALAPKLPAPSAAEALESIPHEVAQWRERSNAEVVQLLIGGTRTLKRVLLPVTTWRALEQACVAANTTMEHYFEAVHGERRLRAPTSAAAGPFIELELALKPEFTAELEAMARPAELDLGDVLNHLLTAPA